MIDQICINGILQVAALIVREQDVDGLGAWITAIGSELRAGLCGNAVVD